MGWLGLILGAIALGVAMKTRTRQQEQERQLRQLRTMLLHRRPERPTEPRHAEPDRPPSVGDLLRDISSQAAEGLASSDARPEQVADEPTDAQPDEVIDKPATEQQPTPTDVKRRALHRLAQATPSAESVEEQAPEESEAVVPEPVTGQTTETEAADESSQDFVTETESEPEPVATAAMSTPTSSFAKDVMSGKPAPKPKRGISLEEVIGAKLYIWAAGVCLMLAGAFLVKFSFDKDLLTVGMRLWIAAGFGMALSALSLWARGKSERIGAALCGAGVADLFATVLATTAYYELLDPWLGFALMAVVTALAVVFSLIHGPYVALLGLVGGFVTPALIGGEESAWGPTFAYLLLLEIGLTVVTRRRGWFGLSTATLIASLVWAAVYTLFDWDPNSRLYVIGFVLGTSVLFVLSAARSLATEKETSSPIARLWLAIGATGSSLLLLSLLVAYSRFSLIELSALGLLAAGSLVLARLERRYVAMMFMSAGLCAAMTISWPMSQALMGVAIDAGAFYSVVIGYGVVFSLGGLLCLWRNDRPTSFIWLSSASALVFTVIAQLGVPDGLPGGMRWWMVYTAVGVWLCLAGGVVWRSRATQGTLMIDAYALIAAAAGTIAIGLGVELPWTAPGWAVFAVITAALGVYLNLPRLRIATGWLTVFSLLLLVVPGPTGYDPGELILLNKLLLHYGVPVLCFGIIAWLYRRGASTMLRDAYQALALLLGAAGMTLEVRHGFHGSAFLSARPELYEAVTCVVVYFAAAGPILWRLRSPGLNGLRQAAVIVGIAGLGLSVLGPLLGLNPLLVRGNIGDWPVLNGLLYAYGVPCVLALAFAWVVGAGFKDLRPIAGGVSFLLFFALITLEVRHGFVGADMRLSEHPSVALTEWPTYALIWISAALAMLWWNRRCGTDVLGLPAMALTLAGLVAVVLGPVLIDNPLFRTSDVGGLPILNWLLYVYGVPCVLALVMGVSLSDKYKPVKQGALAVSFIMLFVLLSLQVRHGFVGPQMRFMDHPRIGLTEWPTYALIWIAAAYAMLRWDRWRKTSMMDLPATVLTLAGMTAMVLGPILIDNPLTRTADVGALPIVNWLFYIYGLPSLVIAMIARSLPERAGQIRPVAVVLSILLLFVFVTLQVRQGFVGADLALAVNDVTSAENYTYSLAWVVLGIVLLVSGIMADSKTLRYASLAVMLIAVGKVFIFDTKHLRDLWRVLSFLGLGVSLMALGYVYQRFVFGKKKIETAEGIDAGGVE